MSRVDDLETGDGRWDEDREPRLGTDPEGEEEIDNDEQFVEDFLDTLRPLGFLVICSK